MTKRRNDIKFTLPFTALLSCGILGSLTIISLTLVQFFKVLTLKIGWPSLSNFTSIEGYLIGLFFIISFVGFLIGKFTTATSQDVNPPSVSYLKMKSSVRVFVFFLCCVVTITQ